MNTCNDSKKLVTLHSKRTAQLGFTLVELLVALSIIGVLAAIVAGAIRGANQDTLAAKTRGTIAKIDSVLNDRYDEYLTANPPFVVPNATDAAPLLPANFRAKFPDENALPVSSPNSVKRVDSTVPVSLLRERTRLAMIRDLMRMEMPDCPADLAEVAGSTFRPRQGANIFTGMTSTSSGFLFNRVDTSGRFGRILQRVSLGRDNTGTVDPVVWARANANAELLYLIVEDSTLNGSSAIEAFGNSEIGDTDNDGLFEFLDAWGIPIRWLRCPSGINSTARFDPDPLHPKGRQPSDPLDPTLADVGYDTVNAGVAFALPSVGQRPLVISAGSDGRFGIRFFGVDTSGPSPISSPYFSTSAVILTNSTVPRKPAYAASVNFYWPDPYTPRNFLNSGVDMRLGAVMLDTFDTVNDPVGIEYSGATATFIPSTSTDTKYSVHAQDNVSNLDESGASL